MDPEAPMTVVEYTARWPMAAEKCELLDGVAIWYGRFTEVDRLAAERAFPGRRARLDEHGNLELHAGAAKGVFHYAGPAYARPVMRGIVLGDADDVDAGYLDDAIVGVLPDAISGGSGWIHVLVEWRDLTAPDQPGSG